MGFGVSLWSGLGPGGNGWVPVAGLHRLGYGIRPTVSKTKGRPISEFVTPNVFIKCQGSRRCGPAGSLHVLGGVRGAVILLVCDEGGQAAEPDVAQAAVAVATTTTTT